ncbi:MAG: flavodoxin family protein [Planctomycetota bacterium]|jgi:multimeric flavodoxin WrbA
MKILGICCSPRKRKTTHFALTKCLEAAAAAGAETELVDLAGLAVGPCTGCPHCKKKFECNVDDDFQKLIPKLDDRSVGGMVVATPVYMGTMTAQCKAFLDRSVMFRRNGYRFRDRVGGVLAVGGGRNGGQEMTIQAVHAAMQIHDMILVPDTESPHFGASLWSGGPGGIEKDEVGLKTAVNLGKRVAEVAARLHR